RLGARGRRRAGPGRDRRTFVLSAEPLPDIWLPGDQIVVRYCRGAKVREVRPVTVVADDEDGLVVWLAPQTPMIRSRLADGRRFSAAPLHERFVTPVTRRERVWQGTGIVMIF